MWVWFSCTGWGRILLLPRLQAPNATWLRTELPFPELTQAPHANSLLSQGMGLWFPNLRMLSGSSIGLPLALYVCPYSRVTVMPYATWTTFILSRFFFFFKSQCSSGRAWIPLAFKICFALLMHGAVGKVALERQRKTERERLKPC